MSKLCSTSLGEHFAERVFENIFFDLRTLSQRVSVSVVKIFKKLVKTAFQVFRWKLSLKFSDEILPFFIIVVKSVWSFRLSGGKILLVMSKLHCECSEVHSAENVFFLDKLNLICPLLTLRKKCRPFDKKVTAGFSRLRSACPEDLFEKLFYWRSYIFISLSLINEKALLFCLINFRQCIQSSSLKFWRNQLQKQYFELLLLFYQLRTMSEKISVFCWTILEKVVGTEN